MKKVKTAAVIIAITIICMSLLPETALRCSVFFRSPVSAVTTDIQKLECGENETLYYLDRPPVERSTESELSTWAVKSAGPFHFAYYYGEG